MSEQLLALAERSAENDLAFLIKAKEEAKKRMKDNPSPENIRAFERAKAAVEGESARLRPEAAALRVFRTQRAAAEFLKNSGFMVSKSKINSDVKVGRVARNADGHYEEGALLAYASLHLQPLSALEDREASQAALQRLTADATLKEIQAERMRIRLAAEQGKYVSREDHELDLAMRAQLFRNETENFCYRAAAELIVVCGGDEARLEEVQRWLLRETERWLDAFSGEREFVIEGGEG